MRDNPFLSPPISTTHRASIAQERFFCSTHYNSLKDHTSVKGKEGALDVKGRQDGGKDRDRPTAAVPGGQG